MTPREFEDILMLVVAIVDFILLIFISFKIFTSSKKVIIKTILFLLTLALVLPFWYLIQFVTYYSLARIVPNNQIINCFLLSEKNCKKRPDCELHPDIGINNSYSCMVKNHAKISPCILLNEIDCENRPDCELVYPEPGLGKAEPECISIPDQHRKSNN